MSDLLPRLSLRTRLSLIYGSLFLVTGAVLLALMYFQTSSAITKGFNLSSSGPSDVVGASDMLIRSPELGRALAKTLADKPAALMRGHGAVVVAPSLHVVVGRAYYMALNARLQQQALVLGGKITYLDVEEARKASTQDGYERAWSYWSQKASK